MRAQISLILLQKKGDLVKIISHKRVTLWISFVEYDISVDNSVENIVTRNKYFSLVLYVKNKINK